MISNQTIIEKEILGIKGFFIFWYITGPKKILQNGLDTIRNLESIFAARLMFLHLTEPIFQDYTRAGRFLGILIRLLRIALALFFYFLTILLFISLAIIWVLIPLIAIWQIIN